MKIEIPAEPSGLATAKRSAYFTSRHEVSSPL